MFVNKTFTYLTGTYLKKKKKKKNQGLLSTSLTIATYKEKVDKLKLAEVVNQFCFQNEHHISI